MIIAASPGIRDLLISILVKGTGFAATGVKSGSLAALLQSKVYGAYIAKGSIFSYLQSIGATCIFDPTLLSLLLLGGTLYYYFYIYSKYNSQANPLKWTFKDYLNN